MNEAVIGQMLHPMSHLDTDGNLKGKEKNIEQKDQSRSSDFDNMFTMAAEMTKVFLGFHQFQHF